VYLKLCDAVIILFVCLFHLEARSFENLTDSQDRLNAFRALFSFNTKETPKNSDHTIPSKLPPTDTFPRTYLLLSLCQMVMEGFPLPMQIDFGYK